MLPLWSSQRFGYIMVGLFILMVTPSAVAQTNPTASVIIINAPAQVQIAFDGTASFPVSAKVEFTGLPEGYASATVVHEYVIQVALGDYGESPASSISATISSSPDNCVPDTSSPGVSCFITPACQFTSVYCAGIEDISFNVVLSDAQPQQYHFGVGALLSPASTIINYAYSASADFYVNMLPAPAQQPTTTPVIAAETTTMQSTAPAASNNWPAIGILAALIAIAGVVAAYVLNQQRKPRKPVETAASQTEQITQASKMTETAAKLTCIQCGSELPAGSLFCSKCGTKA